MKKVPPQVVDTFIRATLEEDIGSGDITTRAIITRRRSAKGRIIAKENMVVAGLEIATRVFRKVDSKIKVRVLSSDGSSARKGDVLAIVEGNIASLLRAERVMLNILQRLSGIATVTRRYVREVAGTGCSILDTRKTTPGMRMLEKYAVTVGGGKNHRFGLFDALLIKNNHSTAAGGVRNAFQKCMKAGYGASEIETEVRSIRELQEALDAGARWILLDNMSERDIRKAVKIAGKTVLLEASGNITLRNVRRIALAGVNRISVGALTHSSASMDISFELESIICTQR